MALFGGFMMDRMIGFKVGTLTNIETIQKEQKKPRLRIRGIVEMEINKTPIPSVTMDREAGEINSLYALTIAFSLSSSRRYSSRNLAIDCTEWLKALAVMINGTTDGPLSECTVTGVHNPDTSGRAIGFTTVYVDVDCARTDN